MFAEEIWSSQTTSLRQVAHLPTCPPAQLSWPGLPCVHAAPSPLLTSIHSGSTLLSNTFPLGKTSSWTPELQQNRFSPRSYCWVPVGMEGNVLEGH